MATLTARKPDEGFLLSEDNGWRSREAVTLKAGSVYQAGSVLIEEFSASDHDAPTVYDHATGFHVLATAALIAAYQTDNAVILCHHTDASAAAVDAAVIADDAEVKDTELVLGAATTVAHVTPALKANGIKIRTAL